ncbi:Sperm-associated antigen 1 [Trachymyrmex septentrionalis]|uniref:Sperm-associated antigen 1 n=1 Tax=Trachymyrmex septentrionalis TaxID=34720 RepID=A0A151JVP4_9HYME|nr:PREDICTED: RNA polymerase II-associated protein 3 [Trachymyrmex septentrionalis]XP_018343917.1 PREDICTED: RNA polymerase II-associated protein 3 [Trachymyrmex septentrionalis]KYN38071.1 Sperm-associated antigen 1 [Trachymyrmex septentrionalis]
MGNEKETDIISVVERKPEKKTLLERYNIPVENVSYEFISQCTDGRTLERIVLILRSGEEGDYPDLTKHAEERLARIKPTSALLRKAEPVLRRNMLNANEQQEIDDDISNWMCEMQSREKDLDEGKVILTDEPCLQPEIRQIKTNITKAKKTKINEKKCKPKRIASCDYGAWDKYDVDTEINRIDLQDEQRQAEMKRIQEQRKELDKMAYKTTVDKPSLTGTELNVMAEQEREKGNEAFRAADYEEALRHYNASIDINSNLNAYNNRAMTFIKLQHYKDALNDCNTVLSMDYRNIKALLRRALSLEHLEKPHEALVDYEAVLKLEPTNKTAISYINKLKKPCKSRKIRMKIEENMNDDENKSEHIKTKRTVKTNSIEYSKLSVNSDICYCDRAPGPSRSIATKPHLKASYCVETKSNKVMAVEAAVADTVANKSNEKTTRDSSSGDKLSPVARNFGAKNKTTRSQDFESEDIFTISRESFPGLRGAKGRLEKSIFSCVSSPMNKTKPSTVIIEELPSDEAYEKSMEPANSGKVKKEAKKGTSPVEEKNATKKSCTNKNKESIFLEKESKTETNSKYSQIQADKYEKSKTSGNEVRIKMKKKTKEESDMLLNQKSNIDKNKKLTSGKEGKTKASTFNKIITNECQIKNKLEMDFQKLNIESPYEFLCLWQSLKDDVNLELHAKLLRCIAHEDMNKIIGNKLDAAMFSLILRCLDQQFCTPKDTELLTNLLYSLSRLSRFSIISMFMDSGDKKALGNILRFLEKENSPKVSQLRQIYVT